MHVVQLARRFSRDSWGGTETVVLETSKRLVAFGHGCEILCTLATARDAEERVDGVLVRRFPYFYPSLGLSREAKAMLDQKGGSPFSFALLRALRRQPRLDLLHLHCSGRIGGIGRHAARQRGVPYVVSVHGGRLDVPAEELAAMAAPRRGSLDWGRALGAWVGSRRVFEDAGAIICVSRREQELMADAHPDRRVVYLPNGVDPSRFATGDGARFRRGLGVPAEARVLLTVGRIDSQKNQVLAVEALARLGASDPRLRLVLVGPPTSDAYLARVRERAAALGVLERVHVVPGLRPESEDLVDAFHAADVFLLPSVHEPFGIVVLEAWAAGLPVIASRVGGVPHFVQDGRDGVLFDPAGGAEAVALAHARLHQLGPRALAEAGRRKVLESYTWDAITRRLVDLYDEVRAGRAGP
jgi:glycosyltransferase involved in cell wall biosynthesis